MTDELDNLKAALNAATPTPDPATKTANLRLAQENFDRVQESVDHTRLTSESRSMFARLIAGVSTMTHALTSRGGLTATTAIVAFGFVMFTPQGRNLLTPPQTSVGSSEPVLSAEPVAKKTAPVADANRARAESAASDAFSEPMMEAPPVFLDEADATIGASAFDQIAPEPTFLDGLSNTETFSNEAPNPLKITAQDPVSTFSIDVDTASYSVVRSYLESGALPPAQAVRVEEMINYFPYDYAAPAPGTTPFQPTVSVLPTPWNADTQLVHIAIQGEMPAIVDRAPLNLVFLIDTSGSMQRANKLPLLKQSFRLMLGQLRPTDAISIVTYAGSAGQVLEPTSASDRNTILAALDRLEAGGGTAGQQGLQQAYSVAEDMAQDGEINRVILATDGDFNVGLSDPDALKDFIAKKRDSGTYLSVLGFGRGNLDDATMQALAQNGNGQAAYIDNLSEAQKVLVDQLSGALFPIANDVKIQVEFNPATVAEYRLIGYETRALNREDFNNDAVDAGEIGAGHSVTAIYEVTPVGSPAVKNDPLRYQPETPARGASDELGFLRLRYKTPGDAVSQLIETPIPTTLTGTSADIQFSVAIAGFGQLLQGSDYLGDWSWNDAIDIAAGAKGADSFGYRAEAVKLMRLAQSLSAQ
ncbi:MAG: vWA domain-containing protein [Marinosulfonomonas sp.]